MAREQRAESASALYLYRRPGERKSCIKGRVGEAQGEVWPLRRPGPGRGLPARRQASGLAPWGHQQRLSGLEGTLW